MEVEGGLCGVGLCTHSRGWSKGTGQGSVRVRDVEHRGGVM
jgi:hypothetical protein